MGLKGLGGGGGGGGNGNWLFRKMGFKSLYTVQFLGHMNKIQIYGFGDYFQEGFRYMNMGRSRGGQGGFFWICAVR